MFKMSFAVYRRPGLTREQFLAHWTDVHIPILLRHADALMIQRYVQLHGADSEAAALLTASRQCQPPHDAVCELWWDSEADRMAAGATEAGRAAGRELHADELNFCDMARATAVFGVEHLVYKRPANLRID